ncbi:2-isopropylmalate synthase [Pseudodesulfovibrio cashew]|uniref:2-isopropylmalate synthase n=1 Tax=Pseudodesulfovibrio cashew TaxID=2678688 RepID=A0A6I6JIH8_9BACT|nr:2-isopropylmalate synthase [Pseudodesulfovibrio cashew]QGY40949.1 2-isopropylmalate synthase [Pseudodesulfovibrio cashew]
MADRVYVFDTTLRDGEQSPGATMNLDEKIRMARQLETLGVDIIEAGFPIASEGDFEAVRAIAKAVDNVQVAGLCRAVKGDIDRCWEAVKEAKHPRIHTFLATSEIHMKHKLGKTADQVLVMAENAVKHARQYTDNVEFSAEDASRSDWDFLVKVTETVIAAGAKVVNIPDTVGYTQPFEYYELIKYLMDNVKNIDDAIISVHCHNDLGSAVANSLAAIRAGARQVECTVLGIGERAGNAALEDLVMALNTRKELYNVETGIVTEQIFPSCRRLSQIIGMPIPPNKAIVGANAFAHESGVHQDGVIKNRLTYEIMTPASIGRTSNDIVIGKHSGSHAVKNKAEELGYELDDEQVQVLFKAVKDLADKKEQVFDEDVEALILEKVYRRLDKFRLVDMSVFSGTGDVPPHAAVVMEFGEEGGETEVRKTSSFGEGSIDAVFQSIYSLVGVAPKLEVYSVNAVTEGSDALAGVAVRIEDSGVKAVGRANDGDVVKASALAMINALNRMDKAKEEK